LDHPLTILPDQAIEIVGIEKKVMVGRLLPPESPGLGWVKTPDTLKASLMRAELVEHEQRMIARAGVSDMPGERSPGGRRTDFAG
jgi:hypothetical protein